MMYLTSDWLEDYITTKGTIIPVESDGWALRKKGIWIADVAVQYTKLLFHE